VGDCPSPSKVYHNADILTRTLFAAVDEVNKIYEKALKAVGGYVMAIDMADFFCPFGICPGIADDLNGTFSDPHHPGEGYARQLGERFSALLRYNCIDIETGIRKC